MTQRIMQKENQMMWSGKKEENWSNISGTVRYRVINFLKESKEKQIAYMKCEGSIDRRVVDINDRDILENMISCSLYYKEDSSDFRDEKESYAVHRVVNKMIQLSKQFYTPGEVHFFIIWVFYYDYDRNEANEMPLFKVFKKKERDTKEAIFFDMDLNTYDWNEFLDSNRLPKSLICVPSNASYVYHSGTNSLDLIYVFSKGHVLTSSSPPAVYTPFYNVVLRWMSTGFTVIAESFKNFSSLLLNIWENIKMGLDCKIPWWQALSSHLHSISFKNLEDCLTLLCSAEMLASFRPILNILGAATNGAELQNIWGNSGQSWALQVFDFLSKLLGSFSPSPVARCFGIILICCIPIIFIVLNMIIKKLKNKQIKSDADSTAILPLENTSAEDESRTEKSMIEKDEEGLIKIQNILMKIVDEKSHEESGFTQSRGVDITIPTDIGDIYVRHSVTLPHITEEMRKVLKKDINYKAHSSVLYSIVDNEGFIQAILYYTKDSTAIFIVPKTPIKQI